MLLGSDRCNGPVNINNELGFGCYSAVAASAVKLAASAVKLAGYAASAG